MFGETYLIKCKSQKPESYTEEDDKEQEDNQTKVNIDEYYLLKLIDKSKFLKKERAPMLKLIRQMMYTEHPSISSFTNFYMSSDHFYYVSKFASKKPSK